jgi:glycosyltransferase involved in cell wall biosynthesis
MSSSSKHISLNRDTILAICFPQHVDVLKLEFKHVLGMNKTLTKNAIESNSKLQELIRIVKENKIEIIFFSSHCRWFNKLFKELDNNKLYPKVIASHQKRYIPRDLVPRLFFIIEYAPKSSKLAYPKHWNSQMENKYIHIPFPSYIRRIYRDKLLKTISPIEQEYILTGGNSYRDYSKLIEAMRLLPDKLLYIASNKLSDTDNTINNTMDCFDNIRWLSLDRKEWLRWLAHAKIVILPIQFIHPDTAKPKYDVCGMTMLSEALVLGKPLIVLPQSSILENVSHRREALVVKNTTESFKIAIEKLYRDETLLNELAKNSKEAGEKILLENYIEVVIRTIDSIETLETINYFQ